MDFFSEKKSAQKHGRRDVKPDTPESTEELLDSALDSISDMESPISSSRPQKSSGWEDDGSKFTKNTALNDDDRFHNETVIDFNQDDIPVIPDIDEIHEDILRPMEIKPPMILVNTSTYKELAKELTEENAPSEFLYLTKTDDMDLSLLTDSLCLEDDVKEQDTEWTLDSLMNDFISVSTTS